MVHRVSRLLSLRSVGRPACERADGDEASGERQRNAAMSPSALACRHLAAGHRVAGGETQCQAESGETTHKHTGRIRLCYVMFI